ncbi:MAG: DRTGG domain-containing protein [Eubacteriales bacterium]
MIVNDLVKNEKFVLLNKVTNLSHEIKNVYICDLLSWVMAHAGSQCAWVTVQTHVNIVAVAVLLEMTCIIVPESIPVEEEILIKATEENIPILSTDKNSYEVARYLSYGE